LKYIHFVRCVKSAGAAEGVGVVFEQDANPPDDNAHAPNEEFHLPTFYRGVETLIHYYSILSTMPGER
jgi:hypothetical protein